MNTPPSPEPDEFYIGYVDTVPPGIGRRMRRMLAMLAAMTAFAAAVAVAAHDRLIPSRFDFGRPREASGLLRHAPYPSLEVDGARMWLAGQGKRGADDLVAHLPEGPATLRGSIIARGSHQMLEVVEGSVRPAGAASAPRAAGSGAGVPVTLTGEIVDAKCFLGVMNPGEGTVHRDCAQLCLRGGLPPMLLVRGGLGEEALVLLVGADGRPLSRDLADIAGLPVTVRGQLVRDRGDLVLRADRPAFTVRH